MYVQADRALESPQTLIKWSYSEHGPDIEVIRIRRSTYRYPEDIHEGDIILDEVVDPVNPRTSYADTTVDAMTTYYYSVFFQHKGPFSQTLHSSYYTQRIGTMKGILLKEDAGFGNVSYWILARDNDQSYSLYAYNLRQQLFTERLTLGSLLSSEESVESIAYYQDLGASRRFIIVTSLRYIDFTLPSGYTDVINSYITVQWALTPLLTKGYKISGACIEPSPFRIRILDGYNKIATLHSVAVGTIVRSMNLNGVGLGDVHGCVFNSSTLYVIIGSGKVAYGFLSSLLTPTSSNISAIYPIRQEFLADFDYSLSLLVVPNNDLGIIERYTLSDKDSNRQIEEHWVLTGDTKVLWRLSESDQVLDYSSNGKDGSVSGTVQYLQDGRFDTSVLIKALSSISVDVTSVLAPTNNHIGVWYKVPYEGYLTSLTQSILMQLYGDANNYVKAVLTPTQIQIDSKKGGTSHTTAITYPSNFTNGLFHHVTVAFSSSSLAVYIDNSLVGSVSFTGTWGAPTTVLSLSDTTVGTEGYYEDLVLLSSTKSEFTRYSITSSPYTVSAFSGRDPATSLVNLRDKLFTYFGEYIGSQDYELTQLPANKILDTTEVIFRQPNEDLVKGHLGGVTRLIGLMLDRVSDYRDYFINHVTARSCEVDYIAQLGELICADALQDGWNVESCRRFLEIMYTCYKRGGTVDSFKSLVRFYGYADTNVEGFSIYDDIDKIIARVKLDSCISLSRPHTPFDSSIFDSSFGYTALATLLIRFFSRSFTGTVGTTSLPSARLFEDITAPIGVMTTVGGMLELHNPLADYDDGQYLVTNIIDAFSFEVDRDWPVGTGSSLAYRLYWRIPNSDPYTDNLISYLNNIKARWQELVKYTP